MRKFFSYLCICFSARTCKYFQYLLVCVLSQVTRVFENVIWGRHPHPVEGLGN
jgi:hypothetical protein